MRVTLQIDPPGRKKISFKKILLIGGFIYVAFLVREIWVPLSLALILAMVLDPVVDHLEERGWSRARASALIFSSFVVVAIVLLAVTLPVVATEVNTLRNTITHYFPDPSKAGIANSFVKLGLNEQIATEAANQFESH